MNPGQIYEELALGWGGVDSDNIANLVQLKLDLPTGTELGNTLKKAHGHPKGPLIWGRPVDNSTNQFLCTVQLSQSSPGNIGGSYFGQNMRGGNILATSVLLNYPKVCPLTKKKSPNPHYG